MTVHRALAHRSMHVHPLTGVGFRTALWFDVLRTEWSAWQT